MRLRFLLGFLGVLLIAGGAVVLALLVRSNEVDHFHTLQRDEALRSAHQAESAAGLSIGQLAAAASFVRAQHGLGRHEFAVVGRALLRSGGLTAAAFIEPVRRSERAAYEARHGFPIIERHFPGGVQRAGPRPEYYPVTYVAARDGGKAPLGFDLGSDPGRGPFLLSARDTGMVTATKVMPLVVGGLGINVYRPIYRDGAPTETVAQRRAALIGFVAGAFRLQTLAAAAISALPDDVDVQLRSGTTSVFGPDQPLDDPARASIGIGDRAWLLVIRDPDRPGFSLPILIAVFGISIAALLGALVLVWSRNERMRELQREASQDPLTGLKNRRRFEEDLQRELARSRRDGTAGALLMLDLDNFKRVNDTLGHPVGDRVIGEIAAVLGKRTRETDVLARVGGDEFAIVLPNCALEEATRVAETIATAIREHVPQSDGTPSITVSVGIAMFGSGTEANYESVVHEADAAMYAAKDSGRDGVRIAG